MKITFLGTGTSQGVPIIGCECEVCRSLDYRDKRLRVSVHVEIDGTSLIIDTGPDFRQQMLRERIKRVDAVLFTHEHKDHTAGLDDIRAFNFMQHIDMPLYADQRVLLQLQQEFSYIFTNSTYPGVPRVQLKPIVNEVFSINDISITPIAVMHHKLPVFGFRIGDFTYITDANYIAPEEKEKIKGSKILVVNALRSEPHISHFSLPEAVDLVAELNPEQAYFTHISHLLGQHRTVEQQLPPNIRLAYDGLSLTL